MSYHSSNHLFYAVDINQGDRACDVCGNARAGAYIYRCANCYEYDECSECHCHATWHTFTRKDFDYSQYLCNGCGVIMSRNVYNCDQCPSPHGYDLCGSCFLGSGHTTSRSNSYSSMTSYAPSYASSSSSSSRMTNEELQNTYVKAVGKKWQAGGLLGMNWIGLMASAIVDAIQAHAFLPSVGQATFHVAKWVHSAKKAASTVFEQASELKAELRRRGAYIPKLSFWGKAKSVLKGATNWGTASMVAGGVNDFLSDDHIVFQ